MADTTFTDYVSPIVASWLNDVNVTAYRGVSNNITTTYSYFSFNGVEKVRITNDGKMGIGTSSPTYSLDVVGVIRGSLGINMGDSWPLSWGASTTSIIGSSSSNVITFVTNSIEKLKIDSFGNISITGGGSFGYGTGSGSTVTQLTDKTTAVTLNKPTGRITMVNSALGANTTVKFVLNNSLIGAADNLVVSLYPTFPNESYQVWSGCSAGFAYICVRNITAGSLSDALILNFAILKGSAI